MNPADSDEAIRLSARRFGVTVSVMITRSVAANLHRLQEFCEHVRSLGARALKFVRLIPVAPDLVPLTPTVDESKAVLLEVNRLKQCYQPDELILQTPGCFGMFEFRRALAPDRFASVDLKDVHDCPAGIKNFVIDLHNDVYSCLYIMTPHQRIGQFSNGQLYLRDGIAVPGALRAHDCPAYMLGTQGRGDDREALRPVQRPPL
jgi:MoaA/NifB/PqqE/SkfB family radical SAM enzyme